MDAKSTSRLCGGDIFDAVDDGLAQKFTALSQSIVDCLFTRSAMNNLFFWSILLSGLCFEGKKVQYFRLDQFQI